MRKGTSEKRDEQEEGVSEKRDVRREMEKGRVRRGMKRRGVKRREGANNKQLSRNY